MREPALTNCRPRLRQLLMAGTLLSGLALCGMRADAQSLDEQYTFYLTGKCQQLNFARDASFELLPGQAGFISSPIRPIATGLSSAWPPPRYSRMESVHSPPSNALPATFCSRVTRRAWEHASSCNEPTTAFTGRCAARL